MDKDFTAKISEFEATVIMYILARHMSFYTIKISDYIGSASERESERDNTFTQLPTYFLLKI